MTVVYSLCIQECCLTGPSDTNIPTLALGLVMLDMSPTCPLPVISFLLLPWSTYTKHHQPLWCQALCNAACAPWDRGPGVAPSESTDLGRSIVGPCLFSSAWKDMMLFRKVWAGVGPRSSQGRAGKKYLLASSGDFKPAISWD